MQWVHSSCYENGVSLSIHTTSSSTDQLNYCARAWHIFLFCTAAQLSTEKMEVGNCSSAAGQGRQAVWSCKWPAYWHTHATHTHGNIWGIESIHLRVWLLLVYELLPGCLTHSLTHSLLSQLRREGTNARTGRRKRIWMRHSPPPLLLHFPPPPFKVS